MTQSEAERTIIADVAAQLRLQKRLTENAELRDAAAVMLVRLARNDGLASSEEVSRAAVEN